MPGDEAYAPGFSREKLGLREAPRLESYRGFWFVSFDPEIVPLPEYLAGAAEYLDLVADQSELGMEIVGGTQSYAINANWKLLVENSYDGYHAADHPRALHEVPGRERRGRAAAGAKWNRARDLGNGHACVEYTAPWGRPIAHWVPSFGETPQRARSRRSARSSRRGSARSARTGSPTTSRNLGIFPNLVINDIMAITVRTFHPLAPGRMNVEAWSLAPRGEAPDHRAHRLRNFLTFLGPGGFATPDDIEALESCQRGYAVDRARRGTTSRARSRAGEPTITGEHQIRTFWRRWQGLLAPNVRVDRGGPHVSPPASAPHARRDRGVPLRRGGAARRVAARRTGSRSSPRTEPTACRPPTRPTRTRATRCS